MFLFIFYKLVYAKEIDPSHFKSSEPVLRVGELKQDFTYTEMMTALKKLYDLVDKNCKIACFWKHEDYSNYIPINCNSDLMVAKKLIKYEYVDYFDEKLNEKFNKQNDDEEEDHFSSGKSIKLYFIVSDSLFLLDDKKI